MSNLTGYEFGVFYERMFYPCGYGQHYNKLIEIMETHNDTRNIDEICSDENIVRFYSKYSGLYNVIKTKTIERKPRFREFKGFTEGLVFVHKADDRPVRSVILDPYTDSAGDYQRKQFANTFIDYTSFRELPYDYEIYVNTRLCISLEGSTAIMTSLEQRVNNGLNKLKQFDKDINIYENEHELIDIGNNEQRLSANIYVSKRTNDPEVQNKIIEFFEDIELKLEELSHYRLIHRKG